MGPIYGNGSNEGVRQLLIPLVMEKEIQIPSGKSILITRSSKYTTTSYYTILDFQGRPLILVIPFDKNSSFYLLVVYFEAKRYMIRLKNTQSSVVSISPGLTVAYLVCR